MSYWSDLTSDVTLLGHLIKLTSPMNLAACLHPDNFFHTSSDSKLSLPALQLASVLILVGLLPVLSSQLAVQQSI